MPWTGQKSGGWGSRAAGQTASLGGCHCLCRISSSHTQQEIGVTDLVFRGRVQARYDVWGPLCNGGMNGGYQSLGNGWGDSGIVEA